MYRKLIITGLSLVLALFGVFSTAILSAPRAQADGIGVIPPRFDLFGNPGDTLNENLKVENQSSAAVTYEVQVADFTANGESGDVAILDNGNPNKTFSLASWITVEPTNFTVAANQEAVLNFQIKIPKNGEPGGHYASILVQRNGSSPTGGGASVASRVGSLILLSVSGSVTENLTIQGFTAERQYAQYGPVTFDLTLKNTGDVHDFPDGTIVITNTFGKKVAEIPVTPDNVLPTATRIIPSTFSQKNLIGRYTATLVATYGAQKKTLTATTTFIVFPLWLLWTILGIILVIFLLITQRKRVKRLINRITSD